MINVGVIGAGRIGKIHIESIQKSVENARVKWIASKSIENAKKVANKYNIENYTNDYKDVLKDKNVDAVIVCSSSDTHADISINAAKYKKHIFCEKPIDYDVDKIRTTLEEVKKSKVKFQVGFNRRFDHNSSKIKEVINEGKIGQPHIIKITSRDPEPPPIDYIKTSGGMLFDMTSHDFDMAAFLGESRIKNIYVQGGCYINNEIEKAGDIDTAIINITLENGILVTIDNSRQAVYGYDQRLEVFGSLGYAKSENDTNTTVSVATSNGINSDKPKWFFLQRYIESYENEMKAFIKSIEEDCNVLVSGEDGLNSVLASIAAKESLDSGNAVKIEYYDK